MGARRSCSCGGHDRGSRKPTAGLCPAATFLGHRAKPLVRCPVPLAWSRAPQLRPFADWRTRVSVSTVHLAVAGRFDTAAHSTASGSGTSCVSEGWVCCCCRLRGSSAPCFAITALARKSTSSTNEMLVSSECRSAHLLPQRGRESASR